MYFLIWMYWQLDQQKTVKRTDAWSETWKSVNNNPKSSNIKLGMHAKNALRAKRIELSRERLDYCMLDQCNMVWDLGPGTLWQKMHGPFLSCAFLVKAEVPNTLLRCKSYKKQPSLSRVLWMHGGGASNVVKAGIYQMKNKKLFIDRDWEREKRKKPGANVACWISFIGSVLTSQLCTSIRHSRPSRVHYNLEDNLPAGQRVGIVSQSAPRFGSQVQEDNLKRLWRQLGL